MYSNRAQEYSADLVQGGHLKFPALFQDNAYGTRRFRKPVAWPKVDITVITEPATKSQV